MSQKSRTIRALTAYATGGGSFDAIPPTASDDGVEIGRAVRILQAMHRRGTLSDRTRQRLEAIPGWTWDRPKDHRYKGDSAATVLAVRAYAEGGGDCARIPWDLVIDSIKVSRAASYLRARYHRGELTADVVATLEALPGWSWRAAPGESQQSPEYGRAAGRRPHSEVFLLLERYVERHGHAWVPRYHVEDGFRLGSWLQLQRRLHRRGRVPIARVRRLEALRGWSWDPTADRAAAKMLLSSPAGTLEALQRHMATGGRPVLDPEVLWNGVPLLPALNEVRRLHALNQLPPPVVQGFEAIDGWDWTPADRVGLCLTALRRFVAREGHACVPRRYCDGDLALGRWVCKARERYHAGTLPEILVQLLGSIPGWRWSFRSPATVEGNRNLATLDADSMRAAA